MAGSSTRRVGRTTSELCTVDEAAQQLSLHPRTILRFIRDGRLAATRIGKSYRIVRADLQAFAGLPVSSSAAGEQPSITAIVDIPGVEPELAKKWAGAVTDALSAKPRNAHLLRADVIYDPGRSQVKIVIVGAPQDTVNLLALIQVWLDQLVA